MYSLIGADTGATASFGDYSFTPNAGSLNTVVVNHNNNRDVIQFESTNETGSGFSSPHNPYTVYVIITNPFGQFLTSDALPPVSAYSAISLDPAMSYSQCVGQLPDGTGFYDDIAGSFTSLSAETVNPVPEASTTVSLSVMLGLGGLALGIRARRKKTTP